MHIITKLGAGAVAIVLLGACGSDSKSATSTTKVAATTTVAAAKSTTTVKSASAPTTTVKSATGPTTTVKSASASGTTTTVKSATAPTTTVKASTATTTAGAAASSATVDLATMTVGKVLVDKDGNTLYLYTKDTQNKPSTCDGTCATTWPPETVTGTPTAGTGVTASKLTVVKRADGTEQLVYNGWPLYQYSKDAKAGDDAGQGVGGTWYVVDASGNAVK